MKKKRQSRIILALLLVYSLSCSQIDVLFSAASPTAFSTAFPTAFGGGSWIAFSDEVNGNRDIYIMQPDGSNKTRLTSNPDWDWSPTWSPDGGQIVFLSMRDGNSEIYVMDVDGTNVRRLTDNQSYEGYPHWSPDGNSIVFVSDRDELAPDNCENSATGCNSNIYVIDINSLVETRLIDSSSDDEGPCWSPDGEHIVFHSMREGKSQLYVMDANGSKVTRLTDVETDSWRPAWSPDGKHIAFMLYQGDKNQIYVIDPDGSNMTRITNSQTDDSAPAWSPDSQHIIFHSFFADGNAKICIADINGSDMDCIKENLANAWEPVWQPVMSTLSIASTDISTNIQLPTLTHTPAFSPTPVPTTQTPTVHIQLGPGKFGYPMWLEVVEGDYRLAGGATARTGSSIGVYETDITFPPGLIISVEGGDITLRGTTYTQGTELLVDAQGNLMPSSDN